MDIGFIGLGNMGAHMARRLIEAGHRVVVYDTRQEAIGHPDDTTTNRRPTCSPPRTGTG